jgi:ABC-type xylose transport system permease subunit
MDEVTDLGQLENRVFRYNSAFHILVSLPIFVFVTGGLGIFTGDTLPAILFNCLLAAILAVGMFLLVRRHQIRLKDGCVVVTGLSGRVTLRVPFSDIRWVNVVDLRKGVSSEGWLCTVTTRQGDFRFSDQLIGYKELASILDSIARSNPSGSAR